MVLQVMPAGIPFAAGGYRVNSSIYLDGSADYLTWTPSGAGDNKTGTLSFWIKRNETGATHQLFHARSSSGSSQLSMNSSNVLYWRLEDTAGAQVGQLTSTQVFRDLTAWMHVVVNFDTTNGTAGNRMRMYVNGSEVTDFSADVNPSLNADSTIMDAAAHYIGATHVPDSYAEVYLAEYIYIDGTQLDATSFGEADADTGEWVPIDPSGLTFGTNGFWLDFAVAPGTSNGAGTDVSGNGNHFTETSLTAAQQVTDVPTNTAADDEGNFCTWNPLDKDSSITLSNGNLSTSGGASGGDLVLGTFRVNSGKWYWEVDIASNAGNWRVGIGNVDYTSANSNYPGADDDSWGAQMDSTSDFRTYHNGSYTSHTMSPVATTSDKVLVALDADNDKLWLGRYDDSAGVTEWADSTTGWTGDPSAGTNATFTLDSGGYIPAYGAFSSSSDSTVNFGASAFSGSVPTDFKALNTANLPTPTVTDPSAYFASLLYTGNGTAIGSAGNAITGAGFQPDFVWIKNRDAADEHMLYDVVRGATKDLNSDSTSAEATDTEGLSTFDSDGFTVGSNVAVNTNTENYVAWCFKAGGSASSNTDGSITSSVSVADHGGFSVGTFTAGSTGSVTVGHGLSRAPSMLWVKSRDAVAQWWTYHDAVGAGNYVVLQGTAASAASTAVWDNTAPTTSVFSTQDNGAWLTSGDSHHFACFAKTPGLIGIGSYTGNGSTDGPVIVVDDGGSGFRPAMVIIKRVDLSQGWRLFDGKINSYNPADTTFFPNGSNAEGTGSGIIDMLANGFKCRDGGNDTSASGGTYIYLAFAEMPFQTQARAR